jgi:hypothetical protein
MKTLLFTALATLAISKSAFSMPCDTGYICKSKSYEVAIQTCRYTSYIRLSSVKIKGSEVDGAELGANYDGTYDGGPLAFEVNIPVPVKDGEEPEATRLIKIEIPAGSSKGSIRETFTEYQPGSPKLIRKEQIKCIVD